MPEPQPVRQTHPLHLERGARDAGRKAGTAAEPKLSSSERRRPLLLVFLLLVLLFRRFLLRLGGFGGRASIELRENSGGDVILVIDVKKDGRARGSRRSVAVAAFGAGIDDQRVPRGLRLAVYGCADFLNDAVAHALALFIPGGARLALVLGNGFFRIFDLLELIFGRLFPLFPFLERKGLVIGLAEQRLILVFGLFPIVEHVLVVLFDVGRSILEPRVRLLCLPVAV